MKTFRRRRRIVPVLNDAERHGQGQIEVLFHASLISATASRPLYFSRHSRLPGEHNAGWTLEPVRTLWRKRYLATRKELNPDSSAPEGVAKLLYRPSYQGSKFFCNSILFAICTSTFSKLCKNMYTVACRRVLSSTPL
jgi:hypothetical protein